MDTPFLILYSVLTLSAFYFITENPSQAQYFLLLLEEAYLQFRGLCFRFTIGTSLWITRRSFKKDRLGRFLSWYELRGIRNNPAYRELFQNHD